MKRLSLLNIKVKAVGFFKVYLKKQKGGVPVIDLSWKVFSKTGNIETYLLMKELEMTYEQTMNNQPRDQDQVEDGFKHIK